MTQGKIIIISGPSGAGKGTLISTILKGEFAPKQAVSATTRQPRPNEKHGQEYFFLTEQAFDDAIETGDFLEWCHVHGKRYGTLNSEVEKHTSQGFNVVLEIDTQGAEKIKKERSDIVSIFIAPPDLNILKQRLIARKTNTAEDIERRLGIAKQEMDSINDYDYVIINDDLADAKASLETIMTKI